MNNKKNSTQSAGAWTRLELWKKILIGMILGVIAGTLMGPDAEIFKPLGTLFINAIKMLLTYLLCIKLK